MCNVGLNVCLLVVLIACSHWYCHFLLVVLIACSHCCCHFLLVVLIACSHCYCHFPLVVSHSRCLNLNSVHRAEI